jgi:formate dehydrogenase iron-sulfur subunit
MMSDVCKLVQAGCLEVCRPRDHRTGFDTVFIQRDVCNGCQCCVAGCPFGVIRINDQGVAGSARFATTACRPEACCAPRRVKPPAFSSVDQRIAAARRCAPAGPPTGHTQARLYGRVKRSWVA